MKPKYTVFYWDNGQKQIIAAEIDYYQAVKLCRQSNAAGKPCDFVYVPPNKQKSAGVKP